ncbi:hypothetical protein AB0G02_09385 [Actinosynnema sp. NPDC023658]|uniref:hypothetical protein n=1 Tax=Actinosynnema sp. NPDC023658 TaxID=3155465 RepID=UPI0033DA34EC
MNELPEVQLARGAFGDHMLDIAREEAPRTFAIVEEWGDQHAVRVAGYGLAFDDRVDVNSVEGDFRLSSQSPESALAMFGVSTGLADIKQLHLVWLDGALSDVPPFAVLRAERRAASSA